MKVLFIGDIVGRPGREAVVKLLPGLKKAYDLDFVVANAENASGGSGITPLVADELFHASVDVLTSGDHIWKKREVFELINKEARILRPANFPSSAPGSGFGIFTAQGGLKIGVINILGRVFLEPLLECPFKAAIAHAESIAKETKTIILDIHAEATSEKVALGWYLDGKVSAIFGTHTHVQTADERILPKGTAYITDVGMTGPCDSVIGRRTEDVLEKFLTSIPVRFEVAKDNIQLQGAVVDIDEKTGKSRSIIRIKEGVPVDKDPHAKF